MGFDRNRGRAYHERDAALARIGFYSYGHYQNSDLWKAIRERALAGKPNCELCGEPAACVHHLSYRLECLKGNKPHSLVCLCNRCHERVEFKEDGRKRTFEAVMKYTRRLLGRATKEYP